MDAGPQIHRRYYAPNGRMFRKLQELEAYMKKWEEQQLEDPVPGQAPPVSWRGQLDHASSNHRAINQSKGLTKQ